MVEQFYAVGLALGAQDNGGPGYRDYAPGYYAAFIIDKNGHNLEAIYWDKCIDSLKSLCNNKLRIV